MRSLVPAVAVVALLAAPVSTASAYASASTPHVVKLDDKITGAAATAVGKKPGYRIAVTKPKGDTLNSYKLTFGDGTKAVKGKSPASRVFHTFAKPGAYKITLIVTDVFGKSATATLKVTVSAVNLLQNGDAEASPGAPDDSTVDAPVAWTTTGQFTTVHYGASGGFPDASNSSSIKGGANFFAGGNPDATDGVSTATQTVDLSSSAAKIDAGKASATLAADLGGFSSQGDNMVVTATFLDATGTAVGTLTIGPVTPDQRAETTELLAQSASAAVPAGTRSVQVVMTSTRTDGEYDDGYADNVSLSVTG